MNVSKFGRRQALQIIGAGAAALALPSVRAQGAWPTAKPLRMVIGFAPGGASDVITRVVAKGLSAQIGQQVIVENKPGAESTIAAIDVMKAPPDGYTILMGTNTAMVAVPSLRPNPPYDTFKAFTPLSSMGEFSMFLAVSPQLPSRNLNEFLEHVAANPGKYNSASSNSASELAMLQLLNTKGAKVVNVRYKGDPPALTDMIGGQIQMMFSTGTLMPTMVKDGRLRALVTLLPQRSPLLPDVPTAREVGLGNLTITPWAGFFGPANMPPELAERVSAALRATIASPEVREQMQAQGFSGYGMTPAEFTAFVRKQHESFNRVVKENNVKFE
ncbi:tripartite tricarboxylate transporter substrate binding protein [Ramlibacter sp. AW1]|uniref:Tripartite tricarboxylate transporter substrate binding protein n=1 Tax=Ramlibacter aurantiacus TaxID=2801330 RepID=A0A936ZKM9_9BURK|nr:tripartite tricarboxylate transporter substrate binding protein [Ramlibacter aurantiacus]MBL0418960.1 tripartite tricarboxylate transporter substrate binding protein [Ramlibacter aurantiacus]